MLTSLNPLLEDSNVEVNTKDEFGRTLLHLAIEAGYEDVAMAFLSRPDVITSEPDRDGHTPLSRAAMHNHHRVVKLLLDKPDVTRTREICGWVELHYHGPLAFTTRKWSKCYCLDRT